MKNLPKNSKISLFKKTWVSAQREEVEAWFAAAEKWCNESMARAKKKEAKKKRL